jgi:hypothetical protein
MEQEHAWAMAEEQERARAEVAAVVAQQRAELQVSIVRATKKHCQTQYTPICGDFVCFALTPGVLACPCQTLNRCRFARLFVFIFFYLLNPNTCRFAVFFPLSVCASSITLVF